VVQMAMARPAWRPGSISGADEPTSAPRDRSVSVARAPAPARG
jgi:hypothetical protein